jgi:hypothetical protein
MNFLELLWLLAVTGAKQFPFLDISTEISKEMTPAAIFFTENYRGFFLLFLRKCGIVEKNT